MSAQSELHKENSMESRCRYTRINGARCAMPALHGHDLCYEHQQRKRHAQRKPVPSDPKAPGPLVNLVYMDDHASVLANLNAIAEAFAYGLIDHRQLGALTRLMQTCLKALHQKYERTCYERTDHPVQEVAYDEDGLALAVDPPPAPMPEAKPKSRRPRYSDTVFGNTVEISAGAALEPARTAPERSAGAAPEITTTAEPNSAASAAPSHQQGASFQTLTSKPKDKSPVIKHLPQTPKTSPLFSNTYLPPDDVFASLPAQIRKLIQGLA
jgi:hypothetical protein